MDDLPDSVRRTLPQATETTETRPKTRAVAQNLSERQQQARSRSRSRNHDDDPEELNAFLAERVVITTDVKGNRRKQMAGKTLRYEHCNDDQKKALDQNRSNE